MDQVPIKIRILDKEYTIRAAAEEAELQASGKSIQELEAEAEAEAEFEIAELFDDIGAAASDDDDDSGLVSTPEDASEDEA